MTASSHILGLGTAVPVGTVAQAEAVALARTISSSPAPALPASPVLAGGPRSSHAASDDFLKRLDRHTTVQKRGSVLFTEANGHPSTQSFYRPATQPEPRGPTTAARLARYAAESPDLARRAAEAALADSRTKAADIIHLITVSCTGA